MRYLLRRGITFVITLLLVSIITFFVFQIIPGDPVTIILGTNAEPGQVQALRDKLGLDKPMVERYLMWLSGATRGELGESFRFSMPVIDLIKSRLPVTISLVVMSLIMTIIFAVPLGIIAAKRKTMWSSYLVSILTQLGMAIPSFWLGIILILIFGLGLKMFSVGGYVAWSENAWGAFKSLFLPSLALAISQTAVIIRYLRTSIIEQLELDYVRTAYSKGLDEKNVVYKHVLKNALIPVITVLGVIVANALGGSLVVEQVFTLPGLGRLLITSISSRDYQLIQGMVVYIAAVVILINFIVDVLYKLLDPRIKVE